MAISNRLLNNNHTTHVPFYKSVLDSSKFEWKVFFCEKAYLMKLHFNQDYILLRILDTFAKNVQDNEKHLKID